MFEPMISGVRIRFWVTRLVAGALLLWTGGVAAQWLDPGRPWRTAETAHFRIHFEEDARPAALRVGNVAERAYLVLAGELAWTPRDKIDVVLYSGVDHANGFASPLPFNRTGIFLTAPLDGELLDRGDWLELVLVHELTHVFHMDKAHGVPAGFRQVFGRLLWTFPNVMQPPWLVEGLAVQSESRAGDGMGRLGSAHFEAQLRDERKRGFISLRQINADGRGQPANRNYLYGAYFFDYLKRRYGAHAAAQHVAWYSTQWWPFRVHDSTLAVTKKPMDEVWIDFIADLDQQVSQRSAALWATNEQVGQALAAPWREVESLDMAPNGDLYVVAHDGISAPTLRRYPAGQSTAQSLVPVHGMARIDVREDGAVLIAQPQICEGYEVLFDVYQWTSADGLQRLTRCRRDVVAAWFGREGQIVGLRNDRTGTTQVELYDTRTGATRVLVAGEPTQYWTDVAASPEADSVVLIGKKAGVFSIERVDLNTGMRTVLHTDTAPMTRLHVAQEGALTFISSRDGVPNVWRLMDKNLVRLTNAHTAVLHFGGVARDGTAALGTLQEGQVQLRVMPTATAPQAAAAVGAAGAVGPAPAPLLGPPVPSPALLPTLEQPVALINERDYSPLPSLRPRGWWPIFFSAHGTFNVGASVLGSDALGVHQYFITPYVEITQKEFLGIAEYAWRNRHFVALQRQLNVRRWTDENGNQDPLEYERVGSAQWVSLARAVQMERDIALGVGAVLSRRDGVVVDGATTREMDHRLAAAVALYDSRRGGVLSDGPSRGQRAQLFYETYQPFKDPQRSAYTGDVVRLLWEGYLGLGRSVFSAHWVEGRGQAGRTENFDLGGEADSIDTLAPQLNERDVSLRGYRQGEPGLSAANARRITLQWRTPLADIDQHAMVPPIGVNRVSGAVFYERGGVWEHGGSPQRWLRSVGAEVLTEIKLGYLLPLHVRFGVARGLDAPGQTRAYVVAGRLL